MSLVLDVLATAAQGALCVGCLFILVVVNESLGVFFAVGLAFFVWLLRGGSRG